MRRKDSDQIILDILKEGKRTRPEIRDIAVKKGLSRSTAYRHIDKLVELGLIKEGKYELIPQIKEAKQQNLELCLKTLIDDDSEPVISSTLHELIVLSNHSRIAHFPNVIQQISKLFDRPIIVDNDLNLNQLVQVLSGVLSYEQRKKGVQWKTIVDTLTSATIDKVANLLRGKPNDLMISYLAETNQVYPVEIIFEVMKQHSIKPDGNHFYPLKTALSSLYPTHHRLINTKLNNFLRSKDERLVKLALKLKENLIQNMPL